MTGLRKISAASVLTLCLTLLFCAGAYAEEPASNVPKTSVAARSLELDRSTYTDGSVYDNAPPEHDVVKVGLAYNTSAVDYAELTNVSGGGFDIGYYNEDREFVRVTDTGSNSIAIARADQFGACWHILIDASYDGLTQARNSLLRRRGGADKRRIQSHIWQLLFRERRERHDEPVRSSRYCLPERSGQLQRDKSE